MISAIREKDSLDRFFKPGEACIDGATCHYLDSAWVRSHLGDPYTIRHFLSQSCLDPPEVEGWVMGRVGLAKALSMLREELAEAQDEGLNHQFRFEITGAEVEFLVEVESESELEGKAGFGLVSVEAGGKVSQADTHRLRLKLNIKDAATGGRHLEVHRDEVRSWTSDGPAPSG